MGCPHSCLGDIEHDTYCDKKPEPRNPNPDTSRVHGPATQLGNYLNATLGDCVNVTRPD